MVDRQIPSCLLAAVLGVFLLLLNQAGTSSFLVVVAPAPGLLRLFLVDQKQARKNDGLVALALAVVFSGVALDLLALPGGADRGCR